MLDTFSVALDNFPAKPVHVAIEEVADASNAVDRELTPLLNKLWRLSPLLGELKKKVKDRDGGEGTHRIGGLDSGQITNCWRYPNLGSCEICS
jgi:hypothetical protein